MQKALLHEKMDMPDPGFGFKLMSTGGQASAGRLFDNHWHESIELLYMLSGKALFTCNSKPITATAGDLVVINSCDLHSGQCLDDRVAYYCAIFHTELLHTRSIDVCETKYIDPIEKSLIRFQTRVNGDEAVSAALLSLAEEYENKTTGFELAIKGTLYQLLARLLRQYRDEGITANEYRTRKRLLTRLDPVLKHIERHYADPLGVDAMAERAHMSRFHFCRSFKAVTGRTLSDYVNQIRINRAEYLLKTSPDTVSEIAMTVGFNDLNYFSRLFRRYKQRTPSQTRLPVA